MPSGLLPIAIALTAWFWPKELKRTPGAGDLIIVEPRFTDDISDLPSFKFGPSSLTWWGIIGFMVIEGAFFMLAFAAYFFLMGHEQGWPPEARQAPDLLAGTLFTIIIIGSEVVNTAIKKAARARDVPTIRRLMPVMVASASC